MMAVSGALRAAVLALTVIAIGVSQPAPAASAPQPVSAASG